MSGSQDLRLPRAELRAFAEWMKQRGWVMEGTDRHNHTIWTHPSGGTYKLPGTPRAFHVQRARARVMRLEGADPAKGKRRGGRVKSRAEAQRTHARRVAAEPDPPREEAPQFDPVLEAVLAERARQRAIERDAEIQELRTACENAAKALRANPGDARTRHYFESLRHQLSDAMEGVTA